jgi:cytochrome c peroxidase
MHAGQFAALTDVLKHYSEAKPGPVGHSELQRLGLSGDEVDNLIAFLGSLSGPLATEPELLRPPAELQASP